MVFKNTILFSSNLLNEALEGSYIHMLIYYAVQMEITFTFHSLEM